LLGLSSIKFFGGFPMSLVSLPGLPVMVEEISKRNNLPASAVEDALREALLKGYERYRRSQLMGHSFP
jgi:N utilization substance protein A